jgi:hypothetical protein
MGSRDGSVGRFVMQQQLPRQLFLLLADEPFWLIQSCNALLLFLSLYTVAV